MSALMLIATDVEYYQQTNNIEFFNEKLKKPNWFKEIKKIISFPSDEMIQEHLTDKTTAFLSSQVSEFARKICVLKELPDTKGIQNTQQEYFQEDISSVLFNRFGASVSRPTIKYDQLGGFNEPKKEIPKAIKLIEEGVISKMLTLLLGVSRGGKSYLAEVIAGEYNRMLILLDLGIMMNYPNPSEKLDEFCRYLENIDGYVLLIDEMEKVVSGSSDASAQKIMMGKLLTVLNNLNGESGYNFGSNPVIATANRIDDLLRTNPEFINRFNFKYFVNFPKEDSFKDVTRVLLRKANIIGITPEEILSATNTEFVKYGQDSKEKYAKYAPGEVALLVQQLILESEPNTNGQREVNMKILKECLKAIQPQIKYAEKGVGLTLASAILAGFKEVS